jgi:hypothetical protein
VLSRGVNDAPPPPPPEDEVFVAGTLVTVLAGDECVEEEG